MRPRRQQPVSKRIAPSIRTNPPRPPSGPSGCSSSAVEFEFQLEAWTRSDVHSDWTDFGGYRGGRYERHSSKKTPEVPYTVRAPSIDKALDQVRAALGNFQDRDVEDTNRWDRKRFVDTLEYRQISVKQV